MSQLKLKILFVKYGGVYIILMRIKWDVMSGKLEENCG